MSDEINARIHLFRCLLRVSFFFFLCNFYQSSQSVVLVNEIYGKFRNSFPNDNRNGDGFPWKNGKKERNLRTRTNVLFSFFFSFSKIDFKNAYDAPWSNVVNLPFFPLHICIPPPLCNSCTFHFKVSLRPTFETILLF